MADGRNDLKPLGPDPIDPGPPVPTLFFAPASRARLELHRGLLTSRYEHVEPEREKENTDNLAEDVLRKALEDRRPYRRA